MYKFPFCLFVPNELLIQINSQQAITDIKQHLSCRDNFKWHIFVGH